jgi:hypothetical protein
MLTMYPPEAEQPEQADQREAQQVQA